MPLIPLAARLLRRQFWLAPIFLLFWGQSAMAATHVIATDLTGDVRRDVAALERTNFLPFKAKRPPPLGPRRAVQPVKPATDEELDHVFVVTNDGSAVEAPVSSAPPPPSTTRRVPAPPRRPVLFSSTPLFEYPQTERLACIGPRPPPLSLQV